SDFASSCVAAVAAAAPDSGAAAAVSAGAGAGVSVAVLSGAFFPQPATNANETRSTRIDANRFIRDLRVVGAARDPHACGTPYKEGMEAAPGFEPGNKGFADPRLTTWLCRHPNAIQRLSRHAVAARLHCWLQNPAA